MTSTRTASLLAFLTGTAGLALLSASAWVPLRVLGAATVMAAAIYLVRYFWRESDKKRKQLLAAQSRLSTDALAEIQQLRRSTTKGLQETSKRSDHFAQGILEYVAQLHLNLQDARQSVDETRQSVDETRQSLEETWRSSEGSHARLESQLAELQETVGHLERAKFAELREAVSHLERAELRATKHREQALSQVSGVIGVYEALRPDIPYPPFGGWAITGDCARRLVELILTENPTAIVELGSGLSTLLAAQALERLAGPGLVVALEHDKAYLDSSQTLLAQHGMSHRANIVHAPLVETMVGNDSFSWYDISAASLPDQVQVVFVDGPPKATGPRARYPALPMLLDRLAPGGVLLMDDANRDDEQEIVDLWAAMFPDLHVVHHKDSKGTVEIRVNPT